MYFVASPTFKPRMAWPSARVAGDRGRHDGADLDDAVAHRGLADRRRAQQLRQLADAGLDLALLVFGGVVAAVLLEVALLAGRLELLGDVDARGTAQLLEL